jgi:hypothetical protein
MRVESTSGNNRSDFGLYERNGPQNTGCEAVDWLLMFLERAQRRNFVNTVPFYGQLLD